MDNWDEAGADVAITGLTRTAGAHEIFEILCRYGARDFREIGHKAIYVANSFRTLAAIGWEHAEPVLRSLALALLDRTGDKQNPAKADLPPDRPFRRNLAAIQEIRAGWLDGKPDPDASRQILQFIDRCQSKGHPTSEPRGGAAIDFRWALSGRRGRGDTCARYPVASRRHLHERYALCLATHP